MSSQRPRSSDPAQAGAITIMVSLLMLVLLTLAAVGMSRNAFREIITSGFSRQGAVARNVADSGVEWSIYWMDQVNGANAGGTAANLAQLKRALLKDDTLAGVAKDLSAVDGSVNYAVGLSPASGPQLLGPAGTTATVTIGLTRMGKLPIAGISQGAGAGAFTPAAGSASLQAPDLWAVRSDAQVTQSAVTFVHAKEVWISTPVQQ